MAGKPRLLVIERDSHLGSSPREQLSQCYEIVTARTMARALVLLRDQEFDGVYVDTAQLTAVRWAGVLIQAEEILDAIADGVAIVDPDLRVIWANPEFHSLADQAVETIGGKFYRALGNPEVIGPDPCPFTSAVASKTPASTVLRIGANRYLRVTVTPVFDSSQSLTQLIALTRDITDETQQQLKVNAIHKAGDELADLTPEELSELGVEERTDLLKYNITRHMKDLLGLDFIEIRLLDRPSGKLIPLLTEGMTPSAANRELYARKENNGVTGFVAATGQSYLCPDTTHDPLYLEGAAGARSSLTVPLIYHGTVIGTLNVENARSNAFDERDRQFLEIYARNVASALNTLDLLQAEKFSAATASVEAISRELAIPLDDILNDGTTVLDRYAGHDDDIIARLRHLLVRAREIRSLIHKVGTSIAPEPKRSTPRPAPRLSSARLLVVDADEMIRKSAHHLLGSHGAIVETARDAHEAIALARQTPYAAALVDIRLPDLDGFETYRRLREVQPGVPIILMTGFGWDPAHSIVKARQEGLQTVLYKPFRADRLMEAVEQALRPSSPIPAPNSPRPPAPLPVPPPSDNQDDALDSPPPKATVHDA
ncbi:response regulator [Singulisphaera sp. GP187]|uniref:response regulator n=1 Tax=Singulisphaera sp. GP187 TaxID=1882752 RepID=UPI0009F997F9|nr:response regulator [Singulisphaera sp. GP187]